MINGVTFLTPIWCRTPRVKPDPPHPSRPLRRGTGCAAARLRRSRSRRLPLTLLLRRSRIETISQSSARDIERHGIPRERIEIVYVGADLSNLTPDPAVRAAEPTLLYLGRLKRYKRIEIVLDVLEAVPDAILELAGDGDHRDALLEEIARRGLTRSRARPRLSSARSSKLELSRRAWINLTASSAEGWVCRRPRPPPAGRRVRRCVSVV